MRMVGAFVTAMLGVGLIAGCQGDGGAQRQALIDQGIRVCIDGFNKSGGSAAAGGIDGNTICQCAIKKMTDGKSDREVRTIAMQNEPSPADLQFMGACLVEEAQRKGVLK
jgi:hypothetical protein